MSEKIKKNMFWLWVSSLSSSGSTFIFWVIASNIAGPGSIGLVSAISSFSIILFTISHLEISQGLKRHISKAAAENHWPQFKQQTTSALIFSLLTSTLILAFVYNPFFDIFEIVGIDKQFVPIVIMIIFTVGIQSITTTVLVSSFNSKWVFIPTVVSYGSRIPLLFLFLLFFQNEISIVWSYSLTFLVLSILLLGIILLFLKKKEGVFISNTKNNLSIILKASIPKWIPTIIGVLGMQIGVLAVFSIKGTVEGGLYYIPLSLFTVLLLFAASINNVNFSVFSGMKEKIDREKILQKTLKLSFLVTLPIGSVIFFNTSLIMQIFGKGFESSSEILGIFVLSFPLVLISDSIFYLLYARAKDKEVLLLGLFATVPRLILYFILVPEFGGIGAASSIVVGTGFQVALTFWYLHKMKIKLPLLEFTVISIIPFAIGYAIQQTNIGILGSFVGLILTYIILLRLHIIKEQDIGMVVNMIFKNKSSTITEKICSNLKKIYLM